MISKEEFVELMAALKHMVEFDNSIWEETNHMRSIYERDAFSVVENYIAGHLQKMFNVDMDDSFDDVISHYGSSLRWGSIPTDTDVFSSPEKFYDHLLELNEYNIKRKESLDNIVKEMQKLYPKMDAEGYLDQLKLVYEQLDNYDEILKIEKMRGYRVVCYHTLPEEYSNMAFDMAVDSHNNGTVYTIAYGLKYLFLYRAHRDKLPRMLISETTLDFDYAAGDKKLASLRMAPVIRKQKELSE
jgi:hypothetical protein